MKGKLLTLAAGAAIVLMSCGSSRTMTTSTSSNAAYAVPGTLQTTFITQYPTATNYTWSAYNPNMVAIDWDLTGWSAMDASDYVVMYDMDGERYYSYYDSNGDWIGTAYALRYVNGSYNGLPSGVNTTLSNQFSGYTIESVHKEMWKDQLAYELKLKNGDSKIKVLVDGNGNVLKQKNKD